jgi:hypothetical protein
MWMSQQQEIIHPDSLPKVLVGVVEVEVVQARFHCLEEHQSQQQLGDLAEAVAIPGGYL